jgi:hypothetical protein
MRIDHAVYAVRDPDVAGELLQTRYGLESVPGGRHPPWGTANRIVPLGDDYVELLAVVDADVGRTTTLGRALLDLTAEGDRWFAVCLADDDLEATAARLDLAVSRGSRVLPDGSVVGWRSAGIEDPKREPGFPFFITWDVPPALHPGRTVTAPHPSGAAGIAWAEVAGDRRRLGRWLGAEDVPLRVVYRATPGVVAVGLRTVTGEELVLR